MVAVDPSGVHAGAAHGWEFEYLVQSPGTGGAELVRVAPLGAEDVARLAAGGGGGGGRAADA